jgi:hypothetical protein
MNKTEVPGIYKESEGVLINKDNEALDKYRKKRELLWEKEARINKIEEDLQEIKSLLRKLTKE